MFALRLLACHAFLLGSFLAGCASQSVVPESLEKDIDPTLTFSRLKGATDSYAGRLIVLGGEVLSAKRMKEGTRIEILQLPLDEQEKPDTDRLNSQGRFLAVKKDFLDPATLPEGTRITIVGEVKGTTTLPLDETEYRYPTLRIRQMKVWPKQELYPYAWYPPPYAGGYWGPYRYPYWGPYWRHYPYWW